jgi:hypothetical protein
MTVDMSPKAISQRLRTMDELWLLSVKLMESKEMSLAEEEIVPRETEKANPGSETIGAKIERFVPRS